MAVMEMQSQARPAVRWTEVCASEHGAAVVARPRPQIRAGELASARTLDRRGEVGHRSVAPGRRVLVRPASAERVRACRVEAPATSPVVDDVPAWVLVACGVVFGMVMLLALALVGGPTYV